MTRVLNIFARQSVCNEKIAFEISLCRPNIEGHGILREKFREDMLSGRIAKQTSFAEERT
jgi:hypothetical protein